MPDHDQALREHLLFLLRGGGAHVKFEDAIKDFPAELRGKKPRNAPHTPWQLLEHMRLAQWDILDFCTNPNYREMEWPAGYWPKTAAPPDDAAWEMSVKAFRADAKKMQALVENPATDLFVLIPWATAKPCCGRRCSWPITMPTTSASSLPSANYWAPGSDLWPKAAPFLRQYRQKTPQGVSHE